MSRSSVRTHVFKLIYQLEFIFNNNFNNNLNDNLNLREIFNNYCKRFDLCVEKEIEIANKEFFGVIEHLEKIDEIIIKYSKWPIDRLNKIDLALIRLALYEILFESNESTTPIIITSEIVDLANNYGDDNSTDFVNGFLAKFIKDNFFNYNY
jgi:N utilization substance protein B